MKKLIKGAYQTSNDLTVADSAYSLSMVHFWEWMFTTICCAKHAHYLLGVADKVEEAFKWKYVFL